MPNLHSINIQGRFGADPELRFTSKDTAVANFNLAVDTGYGDYAYTEWYRCTAWDKAAELICEHFRKGDGIIVFNAQGRTREWEDQDGDTRYTFELTVRDWCFPAGRSDGGGGGERRSSSGKSSGGGQRRQSRNRRQSTPAVDDDDLPFE